MAISNLTAEKLRQILDYDPDTGGFRWKVGRRRVFPGDAAGTLNKRLGYLIIGIERQREYAHRLAWMHVHGALPDGEVDHINGDRADNRIANLRVVTRMVNNQNKRAALPRSLTGLLGVEIHRESGRFRARIRVQNKARHLGYFDTPELAHEAYLTAKRKLHAGCTI